MKHKTGKNGNSDGRPKLNDEIKCKQVKDEGLEPQVEPDFQLDIGDTALGSSSPAEHSAIEKSEQNESEKTPKENVAAPPTTSEDISSSRNNERKQSSQYKKKSNIASGKKTKASRDLKETETKDESDVEAAKCPPELKEPTSNCDCAEEKGIQQSKENPELLKGSEKMSNADENKGKSKNIKQGKKTSQKSKHQKVDRTK